jgi:hypothetical protein
MSQYESLAAKIERERRNDEQEHYAHVSSAAARYEASKSPERRAAEAKLKASVKARDAEYEASLSRSASAPTPKVNKPAASTSAPKAQAPKPKSGVSEDFSRGVDASRRLERLRISEVAKVALHRGQAAEALKLLAETNLDHTRIIAQLSERNILADAMRARFGIGGEA